MTIGPEKSIVKGERKLNPAVAWNECAGGTRGQVERRSEPRGAFPPVGKCDALVLPLVLYVPLVATLSCHIPSILGEGQNVSP